MARKKYRVIIPVILLLVAAILIAIFLWIKSLWKMRALK